MEDCNIVGSQVGGIANEITKEGKVVNCSVNGLQWGYQAGGIAALNSGMIENCAVYVTMDTIKQCGLAMDYSNGYAVNSYSNITRNLSRDAVLDNSLLNLNDNVDINNKTLFKEHYLYSWTFVDGVLWFVRWFFVYFFDSWNDKERYWGLILW